MSKLERLLIVFVKNPEMGKVKTRLAKNIGEKKALKVYRKLLNLTQKAIEPLDCAKQIWYSNHIVDHDLWASGSYEKHLQQGSDLGTRMRHAFKHAFETNKVSKAMIIGSDCADLTSEIINRGFRTLETNNLVIGPSEDGGYYLLGMSSFHPKLFEDIAWSTSIVFEKTMERAQQLALETHLLPMLNDIDTKGDLDNSDKISSEL